MNRPVLAAAAAAALAAFAACDSSSARPDAAPSAPADAAPGPDAPPSAAGARDILTTDLTIDVASLTAHAAITVAPSDTSSTASFEAKGLTVTSVSNAAGPLPYTVGTDGRLDVTVAKGGTAPLAIDVDYGFAVQHQFDGYLAEGLTFLWPYFCSNLFPCHSGPDDGVKFHLEVTGVPAGKVAVYPHDIPADAPSYMLAFAIDDYTQLDLGTTSAGTAVHVWYRPGEEASATGATTHLTDEFDFYEKTYGPYSFGHDVGTVSANWGFGAVGGMEHHPYWHVGEMGKAEVHAHEAAHGWYGDGVRIACWEDFVLSEGTVSYLAARAIEAEDSQAAGDALWTSYQQRLDSAVLFGDTPAWPDGCDHIDLLHDKLWSDIPYMKGAFFYRAVEQQIGRVMLDKVLHDFYVAHVGKAATMQEMIDAIHTTSGFDAMPLAQAWLKQLGHP